MQYEELSRLEKIIEKLLSQFGTLKEEKEQLAAELEQKEREIVELRKAAAQLKEEKSVIHGRVSSLISSLEKWEKAQTNEPLADPPQPAAQQNLQYPEPGERQGLEARD
jgi:FtsZ-binding cell division protein ZapB